MTKKTTLGALALALAASALLSGCGSTVGKIDFRCGSNINGGLLLTVDVVRATEEEARRIQELGPKWFYEPMRQGVSSRIQTLTFPAPDGSARCDREISVPFNKGEKMLVIVADYKYEAADANRHTIVFLPEKWAGRTLLISVQEQQLSVQAKY